MLSGEIYLFLISKKLHCMFKLIEVNSLYFKYIKLLNFYDFFSLFDILLQQHGLKMQRNTKVCAQLQKFKICNLVKKADSHIVIRFLLWIFFLLLLAVAPATGTAAVDPAAPTPIFYSYI